MAQPSSSTRPALVLHEIDGAAVQNEKIAWNIALAVYERGFPFPLNSEPSTCSKDPELFFLHGTTGEIDLELEDHEQHGGEKKESKLGPPNFEPHWLECVLHIRDGKLLLGCNCGCCKLVACENNRCCWERIFHPVCVCMNE